MPNPVCFWPSYLPREMRGTTNHYLDTTYDGAGNVVLDSDQRAYTWDPLGMMTGATVDGRTFRFIYNANNERIAAVERVPVGAALRNRTTFTLRGSGNQLLSTWTDDWTSGVRLFTRKEDTIWRDSQLLARAYGTNTMNYTLDHLGSPRLITNSSGSVLDQQNFEPFGGGGLFGSGALQYTGHERDQANLGGGSINLPDYFHARFYDKNGRFLSVDPVIGKGALRRPQMWNRYSYVSSNPINFVDPAGKVITLSGCVENASSPACKDQTAIAQQSFGKAWQYVNNNNGVLTLKPGVSPAMLGARFGSSTRALAFMANSKDTFSLITDNRAVAMTKDTGGAFTQSLAGGGANIYIDPSRFPAGLKGDSGFSMSSAEALVHETGHAIEQYFPGIAGINAKYGNSQPAQGEAFSVFLQNNYRRTMLGVDRGDIRTFYETVGDINHPGTRLEDIWP